MIWLKRKLFDENMTNIEKIDIPISWTFFINSFLQFSFVKL